MADNIPLNLGAGGPSAGADEIDSVHYQRVKVIIGDDGVNDGDISTANPLPVEVSAGTNTNEVVGDAAHGAAVAGNPVLEGLEGRSTEPTAIDDGDVVRALATVLGKQVVMPYALPGSHWTYAAASGGIVNTTGVTVKAAGAAGVKNFVTGIQVLNAHATIGTEVVIRDGTSGTVLWRIWAGAIGGGAAVTFPQPIPSTAATLLEVACITTGTITYINVQGYEGIE